MEFIEKLLEALVPFLVLEAEKLIGKGMPDSASNTPAGVQKHKWVTDAIHEDLIPALKKRVPTWAAPDIDQLEPLIDAAIEKAVADL